MDRIFSRGDVITVFFKEDGDKLNTFIPLLVVEPKHGQTFIPMYVGQKLQLHLNGKTDKLQWRSATDASLRYKGGFNISGDEYRPIINSPSIDVEYFNYVRRTTFPEIISIKSKDDYKIVNVCAPVDQYAQVWFPVCTSLILTHGLQGIKIWTLNYLPLKIHEDCPVKLVYAYNGNSCNEYKLALTIPCAQILLERQTNEWLVRLV
jgi:hypothetical protein